MIKSNVAVDSSDAVLSVGKHVFAGCSPELKIYTKTDKLPLFANAFIDSFENHRDQFIV